MPPAGLSVRRNGKDAPTAMSNAQPDIVTAAVLVIGDEILSGRTKDKNIGYIAEYLTAIGIDLQGGARRLRRRGRDRRRAQRACAHRYTYVFTTGGIGPTHDDITADCVAKAFGVADRRRSAKRSRSCRSALAKTGGELNEARLRMARIPQGRRRWSRTRCPARPASGSAMSS